jgi:hypothetical protein
MYQTSPSSAGILRQGFGFQRLTDVIPSARGRTGSVSGEIRLRDSLTTRIRTPSETRSGSQKLYYCMKGIDRGYLNTSPFAARMLATIMQTISSIKRKISIGMPTTIKQRGIASTVYSSNESWKFREDLPLKLTHSDSSFLEIQQMIGPRIPPNGKKYPAKADRWQNIAQSRSDWV